MVGEVARNRRKLACKAMRRRKSEAIGTGLENAIGNPQMYSKSGEMTEWLKVPVLKTGVR